MIEVGESTGSLQDMLSSLADFYDEEVETSVARFVTVIEPALLVLMGLVIAVLVLALYMPLFQLSNRGESVGRPEGRHYAGRAATDRNVVRPQVGPAPHSA